jgi:hypothetical protein
VKLVIVTFVSAILVGCSASQPTPSASSPPAAVAKRIQELQAQPPANPPLFVASYRYQGRTVYFIPARCCDFFSDLYGADGSLLCHPDGGFSGRGDGKCADFLQLRTDERIIWRDGRRSG